MRKKIKADLITGFLGSGKTTFIKKYVELLKEHEDTKIAVLENDYGAINVDSLILEELNSKYQVDIEMVAGAGDRDCHQRRFKTKLITLSMLGYDRVIVEPSGIYDVDEFLDTLREEELEDRYEINNIISIIQGDINPDSEIDKYYLASQASQAGLVVVSRNSENIDTLISKLNQELKNINSRREFIKDTNVIYQNWDEFSKDQKERIINAGFKESGYTKKYNVEGANYKSLFFMNINQTLDDTKRKIVQLMEEYKNVHRVKGFVKGDNFWYQINATKDSIDILKSESGQDVIIVIGENLDEQEIQGFFDSQYSTLKTK